MRCTAMVRTNENPDARGIRYREIAATLRGLAERTEDNLSVRDKLLSLADEFDQLAASIAKSRF